MNPYFQGLIGLLAPLFDARLVLAATVVICASVALLDGALSAEGWGAAVIGAMWWTKGTPEREQSRLL